MRTNGLRAHAEALANHRAGRQRLTTEEGRIINCLIRWLAIREAHGQPMPLFAVNLAADVDHSSLLRRLLSGKEPFPLPPILTDGYPDYEDDAGRE